jgi:hypothetical protein
LDVRGDAKRKLALISEADAIGEIAELWRGVAPGTMVDVKGTSAFTANLGEDPALPALPTQGGGLQSASPNA